MHKLTPVLIVDSVEACLPFYELLGFSVTATVPEGEHIGFVILQNGSVELMLQSRASVANDVPGLAAPEMQYRSALFCEIADVHAMIPKVAHIPSSFPLRRTFYGTEEIGLFDPAGNSVVLASKVPE